MSDTTPTAVKNKNSLSNSALFDSNDVISIPACVTPESKSADGIFSKENATVDPEVSSNAPPSQSASLVQEQALPKEDEPNKTDDIDMPFVEFSCFYFSVDHPLRQACIRLRISLCVILVNCIGLGLTDPCDFSCASEQCNILQHVETVIFSFFVFEMFVKMSAMGVIGRNAYLENSWNRLDFLIVLFGTIEYIFIESYVHFSVIRAFRVLRPLRAITRIPSLRLLVTLLIDILPMLANVLLFSLFIFFAFGIVGIQLWSGVLRNRCFAGENSTSAISALGLPPYYRTSGYDFVCSPWSSGMLRCTDISLHDPQVLMCTELFDGHPLELEQCKQLVHEYTDCRSDGPNPAEGTLSFDNIGYACIAVFQVISLEGWTKLMYMMQDVYSFWVWIYFVALIIIGSLFAVNLCLVVIATQFSETKKREIAKMKNEKRNMRKSGGTGEDTSVYFQILQLLSDMLQHIYFWLKLCTSICKCTCKDRKKDSISHSNKEESSTEIEPKANPSVFQKLRDQHNNFRGCLRRALEHKITISAIMTAILINTLAMASEHYNQPLALTETMNWSNLVFTIFFTIEIGLKIYAYGLSDFIYDGFNMLDLIIIVIDVVEHMFGRYSNLSVLRTFRLVRVVKLIRLMPSLQHNLLVMMHTIDSTLPFFLLLSLFLYVFALLGMNLFGCRFCRQNTFSNLSSLNVTIGNGALLQSPQFHSTVIASERAYGNGSVIQQLLPMEPMKYQVYSPAIALKQPCPRSNFDSLVFSLFTVLQVFTQDALPKILEDGMLNVSAFASLYFIALVIVGNYVIFNLLVAILVEGFSNRNELVGNQFVAKEVKQDNQNKTDFEAVESASTPIAIGAAIEEQQLPKSSKIANFKNFFDQRTSYSLFILAPENRFRNFLITVTNHQAFDHIVLLLIVGNCVIIGLERPSVKAGSVERSVIDIANHVFTALFSAEASVKILANGLVFGDSSTYLRNRWNILDFMLVICSAIHSLITLLSASLLASKTRVFDLFRVLRILRALRPLRVVNRSQGLKVAVETLIVSIKPIGFIVVITVSFFLVFAVLGLQLFRDCFHRCKISQTNQSVVHQDRNHSVYLLSEVRTKQDCVDSGLEWSSSTFNFDNIGNALMALFVFATFDGWVDMTRDGVDCVGFDKQPIKDYNLWRLLYFVSFLLIVCFFMLNMFVGVVVNNFKRVQRKVMAERNERHQKIREQKLLTRLAQKEHILLDKDEELSSKRCHNLRTQASSHGRRRMGFSYFQGHPHDKAVAYFMRYPPWRRRVFKAVNSHWFDLAISLATGATLGAIGFEHYRISSDFMKAIRFVGYVFTVLLIVEIIIKFIAYGPWHYFRSRWNQLDLVVLVSTIVCVVVEDFLHIAPATVQIFRIFRIVRILKVLKSATAIQRLLHTISKALPQVGNLSILFLLLFFIYAAAGVELYGKFECDLITCQGISRHANFHNIGMAMLALFRVFTGDDWNQILADALSLSGSDNYPEGGTGNYTIVKVVSPAYFVSFVVISRFVLINVVIAVLMSHLEEGSFFPQVNSKRIGKEVSKQANELEEIIRAAYISQVEQLGKQLQISSNAALGIVTTEYALRHRLDSTNERNVRDFLEDQIAAMEEDNNERTAFSLNRRQTPSIEINQSALADVFESVKVDMKRSVTWNSDAVDPVKYFIHLKQSRATPFQNNNEHQEECEREKIDLEEGFSSPHSISNASLTHDNIIRCNTTCL